MVSPVPFMFILSKYSIPHFKTIENSRRVRSGYFQRKNIFIICNSEKPAGFSELLFHERGRREKLHLIKQQPFFVTAFL